MNDKRILVYCILYVMLCAPLIHCGPYLPVPRQAIHLSISPSGVGSHTVRCTLDARLTSMEKVTSLTVYGPKPYGKADEFDSLASVDLWSPHARLTQDLGDIEAQVFGQIGGPWFEKKSSLEISWKYPLSFYPKQYKCVANGLDEEGLVVSMSITTETTPSKEHETDPGVGLVNGSPSNNSSADEETTNTDCQKLSSNVEKMQLTVESLEELVKNQSSIIKENQEKQETNSELINYIMKNLKLVYFLDSFDISEVFQGKRYFVTKNVAVFDIKAANVQCNVLGGFLFEIENKEEYDFVFNFCKSLGGNDFYTGGNDIEKEGKWTYWHSGMSVAFPNWRQGQPDNGGGSEDCLILRMSYGASNDEFCGHKGKFVCEVPA